MISHPLPVRTERVDRLKVRVYDHRDAVGNAAGADVAARIRELLSKQERVRMIFASAPSQNEFLQRLVREEGIDWSRITVFHMDEYIGLPKDAPQRFSRYLMEHLISRVNPGEVHLIDSTRPMEQECRRYGNLIQRAPIDIVCLGIGENGHLAFNDPPFADFEDPEVMKPVELDEVCRLQQVHDGCFSDISAVPTRALTLTIPVLLSGRFLYCIVPGKAKREAVLSALYGPISTECPASILRRHPDCTLYLDRDAWGVREDHG
ncbi:glucosamine-6-phosphate deaminase [Planifilum fimeticola]